MISFYRWLENNQLRPDINRFAQWAIENTDSVTFMVLSGNREKLVGFGGIQDRVTARNCVGRIAPQLLNDFDNAANLYYEATGNEDWKPVEILSVATLPLLSQ